MVRKIRKGRPENDFAAVVSHTAGKQIPPPPQAALDESPPPPQQSSPIPSSETPSFYSTTHETTMKKKTEPDANSSTSTLTYPTKPQNPPTSEPTTPPPPLNSEKEQLMQENAKLLDSVIALDSCYEGRIKSLKRKLKERRTERVLKLVRLSRVVNQLEKKVDKVYPEEIDWFKPVVKGSIFDDDTSSSIEIEYKNEMLVSNLKVNKYF